MRRAAGSWRAECARAGQAKARLGDAAAKGRDGRAIAAQITAARDVSKMPVD